LLIYRSKKRKVLARVLFELGDRVEVVHAFDIAVQPYLGQQGEVVKIDTPGSSYQVKLDSGDAKFFWFDQLVQI